MNLENFEDLRYEIKFICEPSDNYIDLYLKTHPEAFREIFSPRMIHNIYCDSEVLSAFDENISGVSERIKVRHRWYTDLDNNESSQSPMITELKYKEGKLGGKKFIPLDTKFKDVKLLDLHSLAISKSPEQYRGLLSTYSSPALYNQYQRSYYLSANSKIRVTIDNHIKFSPLYLEANKLGRLEQRPFSIIEVKGSPADHQQISDFLKDFPYRPYRFSKYVVGIQNGIFA
ncbi:MAG: VTC domain-containing protein [Oligoflexia bacterium]|nr:VTC domain-containing protein [Oligoflexia bacterium]